MIVPLSLRRGLLTALGVVGHVVRGRGLGPSAQLSYVVARDAVGTGRRTAHRSKAAVLLRARDACASAPWSVRETGGSARWKVIATTPHRDPRRRHSDVVGTPCGDRPLPVAGQSLSCEVAVPGARPLSQAGRCFRTSLPPVQPRTHRD